MVTITIPKGLAGKDDLIVIPKKEFDELVERAGEAVSEQDILQLSREAKKNFVERESCQSFGTNSIKLFYF